MKLHLVYGTETGTAEMLCDDMKIAIEDRVDCAVVDMDMIAPSSLDGDTFYVMVVSTTGSGDVPAGAEEFYETLTNEKPDLGHVRFAMFGLGDRTFGDTFAQGSEKVMNAMLACKAQMVGERAIFDAAGTAMPEEVAVPWIGELVSKLETA
ncbi:MAG: flavodoxin domain-containing protein [Pseudomonadota bacterium]